MTKANGDLQAVILIGPGDRLYPLVDETPLNTTTTTSASTGNTCSGSTGNQSTGISATMANSTSNTNLSTNCSTPNIGSTTISISSNYSMAMLPLCNRPLIYHPLTWLIQNGIGGRLFIHSFIH